MATTPRKAAYGSELTDASVTAAATTVTAQGNTTAAEGTRAGAAADRVENAEDDARNHATATASFVSVVDGMTYPNGARGYSQLAASSQAAAAASETAAGVSEANAAQDAALSAAYRAALAMGNVDYSVADQAARDALTPTTGELAHVYEEGMSYRYNGSAWVFAYDLNPVTVTSYAGLALSYGGAGSARAVTEAGRAGVFDFYASWAAVQAAAAWGASGVTETQARAAGMVQDEASGGLWTRRWDGGPFVVRWAGAVADGATDDSTAMQAAYDFLYAIGGGHLYLPAGRYLGSLATAHYNDSTTDAAGVRGVRISGAGQTTVLTRGDARPATYAGGVVSDHTQAALRVYGSNNIVENLAFDDCPIGLVLGQDPANTSSDINALSFNAFNRVRNVWITNCGTGVLLQPGLGVYYNTFSQIHGEGVQIGMHLAPGYDEGATHAALLVPNRNTFEDCRFTRAWVGWLIQNGDTNEFVRCFGEGISVSKTGKIGTTPPTFIRKPVGTLTSDVSGTVTSIPITGFDSGLQRERLERDRYLWIETGGLGEYLRLDGSAADGAATVAVDAATLARTYPSGTTVYEATPTVWYEDQDAYGYGIQLNRWKGCHCESTDRDIRIDSYGGAIVSSGINVQRRLDIVDRPTTIMEYFFGNYASDGQAGLMAGPLRVYGFDSGLPGYDGYVGATVEYISAANAPLRDRGYDLATYDIAANLTGGAPAAIASGADKSDYFSLAGVVRWRFKSHINVDVALEGTANPLTLVPPLPPEGFYFTSMGSGESEFRVPITVGLGTARAPGELRFETDGSVSIYPPDGAVWRNDSYNVVMFELEYRWDPDA